MKVYVISEVENCELKANYVYRNIKDVIEWIDGNTDYLICEDNIFNDHECFFDSDTIFRVLECEVR